MHIVNSSITIHYSLFLPILLLSSSDIFALKLCSNHLMYSSAFCSVELQVYNLKIFQALAGRSLPLFTVVTLRVYGTVIFG
jgi:hypothetical protein